METVELHGAFMFDCPECGRENFCRSVQPTFSEEEYSILCQEEGVENDGTWVFALRPTHVICAYCDTEFEVEAQL